MNLATALDVVHVMRRRYGGFQHCSRADCSSCACIALANEVAALGARVRQMQKHLDQAAQVAKKETDRADNLELRSVMTIMCSCGAEKVDGICAACDL